jgi:hypothetical protein
MSKIGLHDPFGFLKNNLWPKEGPLSIWLMTIKSQKLLRFFSMQVACNIPLENSWWGIQFCVRPHLHWRSAHKVMDPKVAGVPTKSQLWEFQDFHLGVSGQNDIWVLVSWPGIDYTIGGKVVASPKSGPWWILWVRVCLCFIRAPKCSNYALTNLLFSLCELCFRSQNLLF